MAERRRGMGRGLAAILTATAPAGQDQVPAAATCAQIPVELVAPNPHQPRRHFDEEALQALSDSLQERGVLQPVLVRPVAGGTYELIAGERRWRAAQMAGFETVPAVVRPHDDGESLELALIENMAREDLNPVEEARACVAARRGAGADARGARPPRRPLAGRRLEPHAAARPARRGAGPADRRQAHRGPRPRAAAGRRPRRPPPPGPPRGRARAGPCAAPRTRPGGRTRPPNRSASAAARSSMPITLRPRPTSRTSSAARSVLRYASRLAVRGT